MSKLTVDIPKELKEEVLRPFKYLKDKDLRAKLNYCGVDVKRDNRLNEAIECYVRKIPLLIEQNKEANDPLITEKIARLKEKLGCCIKELEFRDEQKVDRTAILHDTIYYIDLGAGDDAKDGLSTGNAWKTIGKYTTTTVRTAGDIAYVRANTTQTLAADVAFDEDGTFNSPISIIGCDAVTNDPWGDASNVKPIIDANGGAYRLTNAGDDYWYLERLDCRNTKSTSTTSIGVLHSRSKKLVVASCDFSGCSKYGVIQGNGSAIFRGCTFASNGDTSLYFNGSAIIELYDCTFNGGTGTTYGIFTSDSAGYDNTIYLYNCSFGQSSAHGTADISLSECSIAYGQNCILQKAAVTVNQGYAYFEDWQQTKDSNYSATKWATIINDSSIQIDSLDSIKISPTTNSVGFHWGAHQYATYKLWLVAGTYTVSLKVRETAAWTVDPDSEAFFIRASYLNHASNSTRTFVNSSQSLSGTNEITFTVSVSPAQDGFVYVTPCLFAYEAGKSINMSIKPSVA